MIILDENFPESQRQLLKGWRISVRHIGLDVGRYGMKDDEIIPLLARLPRPTFFTLDRDFFSRALCNSRYCLVTAAVSDDVAAKFVRRLLRHPQFSTTANRMGATVKISSVGIRCWRLHAQHEIHIPWD